MSLSGNFVHLSTFARPGSFSYTSRLPSSLQLGRQISSEAPGASHSASSNIPPGGFIVGPWDVNNRIRVLGAFLGIIGASGMIFDAFYRRATKQELYEATKESVTKQELQEAKQELQAAMKTLDKKVTSEIGKLDAKVDREMGKLNAKIDGLTHALLHTTQRDKIAAETANRELQTENERLKGKEKV